MKRITAVILLLVIVVPMLCLIVGCDDWRTDMFRTGVVSSFYDGVTSGVGTSAEATSETLGNIIGTVLADILNDLLG